MKYLLISFCFALSGTTLAQTDFERDTRKFLELTGTAEMAIQVIDQMVGMLQPHYDAPDEFWEEFKKEVSPSDLVDLIVPVYMKYYTHEEVLGLTEFYRTPLGQKAVRVLPSITSEAMLIGQEWGAMLGERIQQKLKEKGY
ncbi:MAG: DUF2059 domain-containing protein [Saprospiraceae bacterium]|nr:DUF2059 domain-containing protein [Saprospiraceae bacterium]